METQKKQRTLVYEALIAYILDKSSGTEIKRRLEKNLDKKHFYISLKKVGSKYVVKEDPRRDFKVTDRLLRFLVLEMYKSMIEDSSLESVAEFVGLVNRLIIDIDYLYLILSSVDVKGGVAAKVGICIRGKIVSTIDIEGEETFLDGRKEGDYTLISLDSANLDEGDAGNCIGGGWCAYFWTIPSPKKKYRKTDRIVFEVDGELIADVTLDKLAEMADQYYTDDENEDDYWQIGLDTSGYDEDVENEDKNWYIKGKYVYVKEFAIAHNYRYR